MTYVKSIFLILILGFPLAIFAQVLRINTPYDVKELGGNDTLLFTVKLKKSNIYRISAMQNKVDIVLSLLDEKDQVISSTDLADGNEGYDKIEFLPKVSGIYHIKVAAIEKDEKLKGNLQLVVKELDQSAQNRIKRNAAELKEENSKMIQTIDVTHFWEAYDELKACATFADSVNIIQTMYLDRATNGLKEFAKVRDFSAERFVKRIGLYKKYYNDVRKNTVIVNQVYDTLAKVHEALKKYIDLKPYVICFAISPMSTPGTISGNYLLIGTEMEVGDKNMDLSEITNPNFKATLMAKHTEDIPSNIEETIAHEAIHLQQKQINKKACACPLLDNIIREGAAEFVSSKVLGRINKSKPNYQYLLSHEKELWFALKNELCTTSLKNWLYNASSSNDRPGDLGYAIGYMIVESYYNSALDKKQAIKDIVEMDNPLLFIDKSRYDDKFR